MESLTVIRWFNFACALMCGWTYMYNGNILTVCIGALNLGVFIFGKQLLEIWNKGK